MSSLVHLILFQIRVEFELIAELDNLFKIIHLVFKRT